MTVCTKESLADQALRIINGGDINYEEDLDIRDIQVYITQAIGFAVKRGFFETKNDEVGEVIDNMIMTFPNIVVEKDGMGYYAQLPSCTVGLIEGRGIHEVGDEGGPFIPTKNGWSRSFPSIDSIQLEGNVGYFSENKTVRFFNVKNFDDHKVYLKLVAAYDAIEEDREISIPLDVQHEVIATAVQLFSNTSPEDKVADNVDDKNQP